MAELERRLRGRGTDSEAVIQRRLEDSLADMTHWNEFEYVVVNDDFEVAADRLQAIVEGTGQAFRTDSPRVKAAIHAVFEGRSP